MAERIVPETTEALAKLRPGIQYTTQEIFRRYATEKLRIALVNQRNLQASIREAQCMDRTGMSVVRSDEPAEQMAALRKALSVSDPNIRFDERFEQLRRPDGNSRHLLKEILTAGIYRPTVCNSCSFFDKCAILDKEIRSLESLTATQTEDKSSTNS